MTGAYEWVKAAHLFFVVLAVGLNLSYGLWMARTRADAVSLGHVLRTLRFVDSFVANPSYVVILVTGFGLVSLRNFPLTTPFILIGLIGWVLALLLGLLGFSPALRRQIVALNRFGPQSKQYHRAAQVTSVIGVATMLPVLTVLFAMVLKPG